jgi:hypothetical protein
VVAKKHNATSQLKLLHDTSQLWYFASIVMDAEISQQEIPLNYSRILKQYPVSPQPFVLMPLRFISSIPSSATDK